MRGFGDSKPQSGNKKPRLEELVDRAELTPEFRTFRIIGPIRSYYQYWFDIKTKTGKKTQVPRLCLDFDSSIDDFKSDQCPYRKSGLARGSKFYVFNAIDRELQDNKPSKLREPTKSEQKTRTLEDDYECHVKERGSNTWTPVRVIVLPASQADRLKSMIRLNVHKDKKGNKKAYELSHPKYGKDINFKYDKNVKGPNKYDIVPDRNSRLTEEELEYLLYPLDILKCDPLEVAQRDMEELEKVIVTPEGEPIKPQSSSKKRAADNDDYESDVDDDSDNEDADEDEKPKKKKSSKKDEDDEDDFEDDEDGDSSDDDEDEDNSSKRRKPKLRRR